MKFLLTTIALFSLNFLSGQAMTDYVITFAGDAIMSGDGALYLTIGEPINTELTDGEIMIAQGFLQVSISSETVSTETPLEEQITVFPNPTAMELHFRLETNAADYGYRIYNVNGQVISQVNSMNDRFVDVSSFVTGTYYVTLHKDAKVSQTIQFVKL